MKQISLTLVLLAIVIFSNVKVQAQEVQDPYYPLIVAELQVTGGDTLADGYIDYSDTTLFDTHMVMTLYDTLNISKVNIVLKKTADGSPLLSRSYDFSSVPRDEYILNLCLGKHRGMYRCYGEAAFEMADGSLTPAFKVWK
jgi:hypothetical protein